MQETYKRYSTEKLVDMYQSTQNEVYLQEIFRKNEGLLRMWVWDYRNIPHYDEADLLEEGYLACWQAVEHFDPNKGYTFTSCLKGYIKQRFNRLYNEATRQKRYTGSELVSYEDLEEINKEYSIEVDTLSDIAVKDFINSLDDKLQYIAIRLLDGCSKGDIARGLGITPASTTYHIKRLQQAYIAFFGEVAHI